MIQTLAFERADPRFGERIRIWSQERCPDATRSGTADHAPKPARELAVTVMDEETRIEPLVLEPHQRVSRLLPDPPIVGTVCGRAEKDLARADMDEHWCRLSTDVPRAIHCS